MFLISAAKDAWVEVEVRGEVVVWVGVGGGEGAAALFLADSIKLVLFHLNANTTTAASINNANLSFPMVLFPAVRLLWEGIEWDGSVDVPPNSRPQREVKREKNWLGFAYLSSGS